MQPHCRGKYPDGLTRRWLDFYEMPSTHRSFAVLQEEAKPAERRETGHIHDPGQDDSSGAKNISV